MKCFATRCSYMTFKALTFRYAKVIEGLQECKSHSFVNLGLWHNVVNVADALPNSYRCLSRHDVYAL